MKKNAPKKLQLNKETVLKLEAVALVAGGATSRCQETNNMYDCYSMHTCPITY